MAEFMLGNADAASIRLEQVQKDDPTYLGGLIIQIQLYKNAQKGNIYLRYLPP